MRTLALVPLALLAVGCVTPIDVPTGIEYPPRLESEVSAAAARWHDATGLDVDGVTVIEEPSGGSERCDKRYGWHFDGTVMLCASTPDEAIETVLVHEFGHALGAHDHLRTPAVGIMRENMGGTRCLTQFDVDFVCGATWRECHWRVPECRVTVLP